MQVQSLGQEDTLEKGMSAHSRKFHTRGALRATVHKVVKSRTVLTTHRHASEPLGCVETISNSAVESCHSHNMAPASAPPSPTRREIVKTDSRAEEGNCWGKKRFYGWLELVRCGHGMRDKGARDWSAIVSVLMVGESLWSPPGCKAGPRTEPPKQQAQGLMFPGATGPTYITV